MDREMGGTYSTHVGDERCMRNYTLNPQCKSPEHKWVNSFKVERKMHYVMVWTGLYWLKIGISGGLL
jgi:hypothetical protein